MRKRIFFVCLSLLAINCSPKASQVKANSTNIDNSAILGRWDVTVYDLQAVYPSWFEIVEKNGELSGQFVGRVGSARPIRYIHFDGDQLYLSLPRQYERPLEDLLFVGKVKDGSIDGQTKSESGEIIRFHAEPAPKLNILKNPQWGERVKLIENDLSNWTPRDLTHANKWQIEDGLLINTE
ncbi:MAG: hypothetical protein ACE5G1_15875, partial [bacterium]